MKEQAPLARDNSIGDIEVKGVARPILAAHGREGESKVLTHISTELIMTSTDAWSASFLVLGHFDQTVYVLCLS